MPTKKQQFQTKMNALADSINTKAGTTGKKDVDELKTAVDGITPLNADTVSVTPTNAAQTITPTSPKNAFSEVDVEAVVCKNLSAGNVKSGVTVKVGTNTDDDSVATVTGNVVELNGDTLTITPTGSQQVNTPTSPKNGYTQVTTEAVVCQNLTAANIAKDVVVKVGTATDDDSVIEVVGTHEGGQKPSLNAPTISASGNVITITNPATNGNFVTGYKIFLDGVYSSTVSTTTATITDLGSHAVTVKAIGSDFEDSAASNSVTIANYSITVTTTNCTASQSNPTSIASGETATLVFTADTDYEVRASGVTATNATVVSVDKDTGTVVIGSATGNVTLAVVGEEPLTAAILTVAGLGNSDPSTVTFTESGAEFDWTFPEVTDANNNVFIKIPTMYRKVETAAYGQITSFSISDQQADNSYEPYPCFVDGNSVLPYVLIGKYCCSSSSVANSVNATYATQTLATGRTNARALGTGYQLYDWQLQKLFVDLALMKSQKVNFQDGSAAITEYLGIAHLENSIWVDGIYQNSGTWYACYNPANYSSDSFTSYTALSYGAPTASDEVKALRYDNNNPFVNFPSAVVTNSSMNTYYCDKYYYSSGSHPVYSCVGSASVDSGLWRCSALSGWSLARGVRLCYRPSPL